MYEKCCTFFITIQNVSKKIKKKRRKRVPLHVHKFSVQQLAFTYFDNNTVYKHRGKKGKGPGTYIDELCVDPIAGIKYLFWAVKIYQYVMLSS